MSGLHRKSAHLSLKIAGGLLAGAAAVSTFAVSAANADEKPAGSAQAIALPQYPFPEAILSGGTVADAEKAAVSEQKKAEKAATATAADMIAKAKSQLGHSEDRKGHTKFSEWYSKTDRAGETISRDGGSRKGYLAAQWCDMFVSWTASQVGAADTVGQDAWTVAHAKWFKANGKWSNTPKPGAIVFFDWKGSKRLDAIDHVGIVEKAKNGKVYTVEGNTSNKVQTHVRKPGQIVGYGIPDYAPAK
ncbi:hypothetical protein GCM10027589_28360 [Actinocorallia lasiicapitis]